MQRRWSTGFCLRCIFYYSRMADY